MITSGERIIIEQARTASLAAEPVRSLLRQLLKDLSTLCRQEMALAKADFGIARLYASLVEDEALRDRVFNTLEAEFNLTHRDRKSVV